MSQRPSLVLNPKNRRIPIEAGMPAGSTYVDDEDNLVMPQGSSPDRMSGVASTQQPPQTMADKYLAQAVPVDDEVQRPKLALSPQAPVDPHQADIDKLDALETTPATDQNGRLKSFIMTGLASMGRNAQIAAASHMENPWAFALGGAAAGGALGAARPQTDEEIRAEVDKGKLRSKIEFDQKQEEAAADIQLKKTRPALEMRKTNVDLAIAAERDKLQRELEAGRMTRAQFDAEQKKLDRQSREKEGSLNRSSREKVAATAAAATAERQTKIPDTFYRGKDDNRVKNEAMADVLSNPEYHKTGMRQDVLDAYGNDMDRVNRAIRNGDLSPNQLFIDPTRGAGFQRDLAATYSRKAGEAQEFDRAIDMTSKSPSAPKITYADFEKTWQKFSDDYRAANPKQRDAIRRKFEEAVRSVRLAGD